MYSIKFAKHFLVVVMDSPVLCSARFAASSAAVSSHTTQPHVTYESWARRTCTSSTFYSSRFDPAALAPVEEGEAASTPTVARPSIKSRTSLSSSTQLSWKSGPEMTRFAMSSFDSLCRGLLLRKKRSEKKIEKETTKKTSERERECERASVRMDARARPAPHHVFFSRDPRTHQRSTVFALAFEAPLHHDSHQSHSWGSEKIGT